MMRVFRLGLTGSIGMGKSTTAAFFAAAGVPVWDADAEVHRLYAEGGAAVVPLARRFPEARVQDAIDRDVLRRLIAEDPSTLREIEEVVHPLVQAARQDFVAGTTADIVVLDIPLLFETGAERDVDATLVVTAPPELQRRRVLSRPGMTEDRFRAILAKQTPDADKRARATHIIETLGLDAVRLSVDALIAYIRSSKDA